MIKKSNAALGAASGSKCSSLASSNNPDATLPNPEKQAILDSLARDFAAEAARLQAIQSARAASTMFSHLADNLALHLFADADRSLESARQFGREVTQNLKTMHSAIDAETDAVLAGAFR